MESHWHTVMWRGATCLFPGMGAFLWQITAMAPSAPISRVMSHSKELLGVAVRKVTPFFTVALWKVKTGKGQECGKCEMSHINKQRNSRQWMFIFLKFKWYVMWTIKQTYLEVRVDYFLILIFYYNYYRLFPAPVHGSFKLPHKNSVSPYRTHLIYSFKLPVKVITINPEFL